MSGRPGYLRAVIWTASKDLAHEPLMTVCSILALCAVLAPLLILFSLKFGLVDTIAVRLIEDVRNREIVVLRGERLSQNWFDEFQQRDDVAFIIPLTRTLSASFNTLQNRAVRRTERGVKIIPTNSIDPLLQDLTAFPSEPTDIVLSAIAAERLDAEPGDLLRARIQRTRENTAEAQFLELTVVDVAPTWAETEPAAFVSMELLIATEDYRDGLQVPQFGWPGEARTGSERVFPRFRLYAASIYDVPNLRDALVEEGLDVRTQAASIQAMTSLDRNLSLVFAIIAIVGVTGFVAAFGASLAANVQRKRQILSLLRLIGTPVSGVIAFPVTQAFIISVVGLALCLALFRAASSSLNDIFAASLRSDEFVSRLTLEHAVVAAGLTLLLALLASAWAGLAATRIEPAEGIADV